MGKQMQVDVKKIGATRATESVWRATRSRSHNNVLWPYVFIALYGAGWAVPVDIGVRLYGAEIVAILGALLFNWWSLLYNYPMLRRILLAYALWVLAIILSDSVNGTALFDSARNMATPILGGVSLIFVVGIFSRKPYALLTFFVFVSISKAIMGEPLYGNFFEDQALSILSIQEDTNFFKVRFEPFITPILLVLAWWVGRKKTMRAAVLLAITGLGYFFLDARSSGLFFFVSAVVLVAIIKGLKVRSRQMFITLPFLAVFMWTIYIVYVYYTLSYNPYGHTGKQLQAILNPYNPFALLLQGRSEWLVLPIAIAEHPFLGWGSWAQDEGMTFTYLRSALMNESSDSGLSVADMYYIPAHSLVGTAWLWSGLLGFIALVWFFRIFWAMAKRLPNLQSSLLPVIIFLSISLVWGYFFSPPQVVRINYPIVLAALIVLTRNLTQKTRIHSQATPVSKQIYDSQRR
jgi:hypothetical protein